MAERQRQDVNSVGIGFLLLHVHREGSYSSWLSYEELTNLVYLVLGPQGNVNQLPLRHHIISRVKLTYLTMV